MKKIMPLAISIILMLVAGMFASAGLMAIFTDTETSTGNNFAAGTLDLKVGGSDFVDDPNVVHIVISDIKPGWSAYYKWTLKNMGSIAGKVKVQFSAITNSENGVNEPEADAEDDPSPVPALWRIGPDTLGRPEGELGEYLKASLRKIDRFNAFVESTQTGPPNNYGGGQIYGLDAFGGKTYDMQVTLGPGETVDIYLILSLAGDLTAWDACASHDINDNIIQSDSVSFDITFILEQA